MTSHPPFRKVLEGVATREQMFHLFNHRKDHPTLDPLSGTPYAFEWFEIAASEYHFTLGLLPPLFHRTGMFGISEYKAGNVTSVFSRSGSAAANAGSTASATLPRNTAPKRCGQPSSPMRQARLTA